MMARGSGTVGMSGWGASVVVDISDVIDVGGMMAAVFMGDRTVLARMRGYFQKVYRDADSASVGRTNSGVWISSISGITHFLGRFCDFRCSWHIRGDACARLGRHHWRRGHMLPGNSQWLVQTDSFGRIATGISSVLANTHLTN